MASSLPAWSSSASVASRIETKTGGRPASQGVIRGDFALSVGRPESPEPAGWKWTALTDVARLETGHTPSRKHPEYWGGDVPWIGIKDATENYGRVISDTYQHTNELGIAHSSARVLPAHTVCLSRTASVGYVVVMGRPMATSQDFVNWVCSEAIDYRFLKYVLLAEREAFLRFSSGTTHQTIYFPEVKAFHVCLPPLQEQRAIVHILGTLDDKIELNRRMNETLEAIARALFRSWFVDFDPVHTKSEGRETGMTKSVADLFALSFQTSDLGEIPKDWLVRPLTDVIEINPTRRLHKGDVAPYLDMANMPTRGHSPNAVVDRPFTSGMRFVNGDTLVARITPCLENGKTAYVDFLSDGQVGWGSTEYLVVRPKPPLPDEFAYCLARATEFRDFAIQSMTGSSGRQRVPAESLSHFRVVAAPNPIAEVFGHFVKPLFARASAATREGRTLAALRDTLLPKLISGELRVKDVAKVVGARV